MFTRTAALMSLSFWELTQVLICRCRPLMKSVSRAVRFVELWAICKVVADYQHLIQLLHLQLLGCLGDLALPLDDAPQRRLVPLVPVSLLLFSIQYSPLGPARCTS